MMFPFTFTLSVGGLSNPFSATTNDFHDHTTTFTVHSTSPRVPTPPRPRARKRPSFNNQSGESQSPPPPTSRKRSRGWEPSFSEPSYSTTTAASTSGYLDTSAKYRDMLDAVDQMDLSEVEELAAGESSVSISSKMHAFVCLSFWPGVILVWEPLYAPQPRFLSWPSIFYYTYSMLTSFCLFLLFHLELPPNKRRRTFAGSIISTALNAALIGTAVGLTVYRL
jgi:hypothetical protein